MGLPSVRFMLARPLWVPRMAGSSNPQSDAELLAQLPPSNTPGALPRELLPPGERILFETRASLLGLYWGRLTFLALYFALWVGLSISSPDALGGSLFFIALGLIWLAVIYLNWRNRIYALTDQRVIRVSGMRGSVFQDAAYAQITNMTLETGSGGGLKFDTNPLPTPFAPQVRTRTRPLWWDGLSDAPRVYSFVQQAFAIGLARAHQTAAVEALMSKVTNQSITCAYCGGLVDLTLIDVTNPKCPRCGAPVAFG